MGTEIKAKIAGFLILYVGRWLKSAGDPVTSSSPSSNRHLQYDARDPAPATGILSKILVRDSEYAEPGTVLGMIDQV